jgi:hypothetical protein
MGSLSQHRVLVFVAKPGCEDYRVILACD